ncbi:hypothetical protein H2198_007726 [Neophaeococcomyces mojaviensis]|uniref:Uncharacterized protein n=1 Tax=Neophaeococcomyces mojaviensis TaxID=3383035 RepID=A0ACC2ZZB0_9EURO|nr:hypothetical protein H2198_007726 [Knufia sp. JES_112]
MSTPPSKPPSNPSAPRSNPKPPTYISSSGHTLDNLPVTARLNRMVDNAYSFFGLYIVSLLSLDPYAAAQNSRFNTRGPGRTASTITSRNAGGRVGGTDTGTRGTSWFGGGTGNAPRGGGSGGPGRRMGTVDDMEFEESK